MKVTRGQLVTTWRRALHLGWPVVVQQALNTLMRTIDIIVTGLFSSSAVAAVGIADLYAQVLMRIGQALGTGAIALSSQDTAREADLSRDRAVTQALLVGFFCGLPFVTVGLVFSNFLIAILGAESAVVALGGVYLTIIFAVAPMRIVGTVGASCLQGTGDTRTPMLINGSANAINIILTIGLGLGIWLAPDLGIVGVALATAISRSYEAVAMLSAIMSDRTPPSLVRPWDLTISRQLIAVSIPNFAEGMSSTIIGFPFNALLLLFGTEVNAAYHIARRVFHQIGGPAYRSIGTVSSIIVGQSIGSGDHAAARSAGIGLLLFGFLTLSGFGIGLIGGSRILVRFFAHDPMTIEYAVLFVRIYGFSLVFLGIFYPLAGALRGAGDTRTPFYARFLGEFGFMLGFSYITAIILGFGLIGVYAGMLLAYACRAVIAVIGFQWGSWEDKAEAMIEEREKNELS